MPEDQATDDPGDGQGPAQGSRAGKQKKFWRQLLVIVVTAIALMLLLKAFVVQPYRIPSQSMEDTLLPGRSEEHTSELQSLPRPRSSDLQLLVIVVTAIALMLLLKAFVVQPYRIPSQSMEDTLLPG